MMKVSDIYEKLYPSIRFAFQKLTLTGSGVYIFLSSLPKEVGGGTEPNIIEKMGDAEAYNILGPIPANVRPNCLKFVIKSPLFCDKKGP